MATSLVVYRLGGEAERVGLRHGKRTPVSFLATLRSRLRSDMDLTEQRSESESGREHLPCLGRRRQTW